MAQHHRVVLAGLRPPEGTVALLLPPHQADDSLVVTSLCSCHLSPGTFLSCVVALSDEPLEELPWVFALFSVE